MSCWGCSAAETDPHTARFQMGCLECDARMLAVGIEFFHASNQGTVTADYRIALGNTFGASWREGHEAVKRWAARINGPDAQPPATP